MTENDICATCNNIIQNGEGSYCNPPEWVIQCSECNWIDERNVQRRKAHKKLIPYPIQ